MWVVWRLTRPMRGITRGAELTDGTRLARRGCVAEYGGAEDRAKACRHVRSVTRTGVPNLVSDAYFGQSIREICEIEIEIEIEISSRLRSRPLQDLGRRRRPGLLVKVSSKLGGYQ